MKTVAVVGATGNVGTELTLLLHQMEGVHVVAVCRSHLASAFLRRCGVDCRVGDPSSPEHAVSLLAGVDVVVDLTLPVGPEPRVRQENLALVDTLMHSMPDGAAYVFASTYMVMGMGNAGDALRWRRLAGTSYGARKRLLERHVRRKGKRSGTQVYVFRLGQVHGELQRVSHAVRRDISRGPALVPDGPSNTVFVSTIAEGVAAVAQAREEPGTYDLVSQPQLTWLELHTYFARRTGADHSAEIERVHAGPTLRQRLRTLVVAAATKRRELIVGYVLPWMPERESRLRGQHLVRSARGSIGQQSGAVRPFAYVFSGEVPGPFLATPTDPRKTAESYADAVKALASDAAEGG